MSTSPTGTPPIVFLCGHRKSGTSLLNNLFDGHPQLCVYPADLNLLYGYFPKYNDPAAGREALLARIRRVVFDDLAAWPKFAGVMEVDRLEAEFLRRLGDGSPADMALVLPALLAAYAALAAPAREHRFTVAKETSIELYAAEISRWFPDCRFIHLVRDPRDNYAAIKAGLSAKYESYGDSAISLLLSVLVRNLWGLRMARLNQRLLGEARYQILRFEDVTADAPAAMRGVAAWLGIDYADSLATPSVCGRPTGGNNLQGKTFSGVSDEHVGKWRERITPEEAAIIEFAFGEELRSFGYAPEAGDAALAQSVAAHYKAINYKYFYFDRFGG